MKRVYVCSPLRGANGQPAERNIEFARRLMRAVFDAGHAPFVPHLLFPQVLTESPEDLKVAFAANFKFLYACDEVWIAARTLAECSRGMRMEIEDVQRSIAAAPNGISRAWPLLVWMPPEFAQVKTEFELQHQLALASDVSYCKECERFTGLNSQGLCLRCFAGDSPVKP